MPAYVNIDTQDPEHITPFWCDLLGARVRAPNSRAAQRWSPASVSRGGEVVPSDLP